MTDGIPAAPSDDPTERAGRLQQSAASLQHLRRWAEAEALAGRASSLLAALPDAPALGRTCQALAGTLDDLGDHVRAEVLYRRAGAILSAVPTGGVDDPLRIRCARGLAANLRRQDRDAEAAAILVAALALAEQLLGPSDVDTLATMTSLGLLWEGLGRARRGRGALPPGPRTGRGHPRRRARRGGRHHRRPVRAGRAAQQPAGCRPAVTVRGPGCRPPRG